MHQFRIAGGLVIVALSMIAVGGCKTTPKEEARYISPVPIVESVAETLQAIAPPRSEWELIEAANEAFVAANAAHESQDAEAALRHYTQMFELLIEAELDPELYYGLRDELSKLLNSTTRVARVEEAVPLPEWDAATEIPSKLELEFPQPLPARVLQQIEVIQTVYFENFQAGLSRSGKYLPHIREELRKAGLPEDLAWMAMVESQFTPRISSRAGAGGMWQFMRGTGRRYGLHVDNWVDERYSWKKATAAAIAYLSDLYDMFDGNWPLAISAYNKGEYGLERAIAANGGESNFWRLIETPPAANRLPRETKNFYPKLLATIVVATHPERYGMRPSSAAPEETVFVDVDGSYSQRDLERAVGLPQGTLRGLNPQFLRGLTPPGRSSELSVPSSTRTQIASALKRLPQIRPATHVVEKGETLSGIAKLHKVPLAALTDINHIRSAKRLQIGQRLAIPGRLGDSASRVSSKPSAGRLTYTVRAGDTLSEISQRYGIALGNFLAWNNMSRRTRIYVGDTLYVSPESSQFANRVTGAPITHVVKRNEFPGKIARRYGVSLNDFLVWNGLNRFSTIRVGDKMKVYLDEVPSTALKAVSPDGSEWVTHKVRPGENAGTISRKYRVRTADLLRWNRLNQRSVLQIGQKLDVRLSGKAPERVTNATAKEAASVTEHVVSRGQNPWTIARRYKVSLDDLFEWNGWTKVPVLKVGEKVIIRQN